MMPTKPVTPRRTFTTLALAAIWTYGTFILAWWLGRWAWGDQVWVLAVLNTFVALLFVPLPVVLFLAVLLRRRMAWVGALLPAVLWLALFGGRFVPAVPHAEGGTPALRVMAFNLLYTNDDTDSMVAAIRAADPDLIALAELRPGVDAALDAQIGALYPYRTLQALPGARFGTGIYSRWPLQPLGSLETGLGLRSAAADIDTPAGPVRFVALHPRATLGSGRSVQEIARSVQEAFRGRERQIAAVCDYLDRWGDRPVILAGDFNLTEFSDAYRCLTQRLSDSYREAGWGYGQTWPDGGLGQVPFGLALRLPGLTRIDYVFHSRHWRAADAQVLRLPTGSDHRPVVVSLSRVGND